MAIQRAPTTQPRLTPLRTMPAPAMGGILVGPWPERPVAAPAPLVQPLDVGYHLARWLQSWAYVASAAGSRRDLRIDLLRGFCVFAMLADHLGGESWLYAITGGNRSYVSAAEGFMFISGLVMGQVYVSKIQRFGLKQAVAQALRRAGTLYKLTVVMTLAFSVMRLCTDLALWVPRDVSPGAESWPDLIVATLTLHFTYHGTDILAMYVFCVLAAVPALAALSLGKWRWVLAASWLVWLGYQLQPELSRVWYIRNSENFPLAAWQVLFMTGLVVGFRGKTMAGWFGRRPTLQRALIGCAVLVTLAVAWSFAAFGDITPNVFDKVAQRPVRLAGFAATAVLLYAAVTIAWRPLRHATGWLLLPLGQHALYCYALHLFLIVLIMNGLPSAPSASPQWWSPLVSGTLLQLGLVFGLWLLVRHRVLFRIVPH